MQITQLTPISIRLLTYPRPPKKINACIIMNFFPQYFFFPFQSNFESDKRTDNEIPSRRMNCFIIFHFSFKLD